MWGAEGVGLTVGEEGLGGREREREVELGEREGLGGGGVETNSEGDGGNEAGGGGGVRGPSISRDDQLPRESSRVSFKVKEFSPLIMGVTTSSIKPFV